MAEFVAPPNVETARASSLPTWPDCERRWMANQRGYLLRSMGYRFQYRPFGIGLYVGSATHAGLAHGWAGFDFQDGWTKAEYCDEVAVLQLRSDTDGGRNVTFDKTSTDLNVAEGAAIKMMAAYRADVDPLVRPALTEHAMAAKAYPGFYLTGHCDLYTEPELALEDYKTGVRVPDPIIQIGAYTLTLLAEGKRVKKTRMRWIRRVGKRTDQPPPMTVPYDPRLATFLARQTLREIKAKLDAFEQSQNPFVFRANTSSVLCGPKYCEAFGTAWCPESRAKALYTNAKTED